MNRIVLKIKLLPNNGIHLELFHLDNRFISDESEFEHFYTSDYEFLIYSRNKLSITYNSLRLPSRKYYEKKQYTTYHFEDETQRYDFLKNLHKCLNEWNNKYTKFIKDSDYCFRNKKVILSGEFWVI